MRGPGTVSPSSYPTLRKLPVQKGRKRSGKVRWCTM